MFDGFWSRVNEAGLTVVYHGGESHYTKYLRDWGEPAEVEAFRVHPFRRLVSANPVQDTFASLLAHGLVRPVPEPAGRGHRDRLGLGVPPVREAQESPTARPRRCGPRTPARRSAGTSGWPPSTRTPWPACAP
ncbi:hypothetical protein ACU686_30130 [Yinghuangia aomiensis]